ncbi:hypothetical protein D3C77_371330 [compost metagenome]
MPIGIDVLEANARGDGPVADIDLVVNVVGAGFGATGTILEHMPVRAWRRGRDVVDQGQAGRLFVHRFLEVAITDADFLGGRTGEEDPRHTRFDRKGVVTARVRRQGLLVAGGDAAATEAVGVVGLHFELGKVVDLAQVLERDVFTAAAEVVVVAIGLVRIVVELCLGQAAGHIGLGIVIVKVQPQLVAVSHRPMGLQQHVVDVVAVVAAAIAIAVDPGIQQRRAQAVVSGTAEERRLDMFPAAMAGGFHGGGQLAGGLFRNCPGHEVDDPTDVLRTITYRAGTTDHIDAVEVARGDRCHRQLRLTIRGEGRRDAIDQHGGARRQARGQAAHADVEGYIAAAGTV